MMKNGEFKKVIRYCLIRLCCAGYLILGMASSALAESPKLVIKSPANNGSYAYATNLPFLADVTDAEDGVLTGNKVVWISDLDGFLGYGISFTKSSLSLGEHAIIVTATDSDGNETINEMSITINNEAPTVLITSPTDNSQNAYGTVMAFLASATDREDGVLTGQSVVWESDQDGFLGFGNSFTISDLSIGTHDITVTATDSVGEKGSDSISLTINNQAPKVLITSPANNSKIIYGRVVAFLANVTDIEENVLTGQSVVWRSDRDGFLGFGTSFTKSSLSVGLHVITVTATDDHGQEAETSITVTVGNDAPKVAITTPADNSNHFYDSVVVFVANATDREDTVLAGQSVVWRSDRDGLLGYGISLTKERLSVGTHVITVTATDSYGQESSTSITITVGNASPKIFLRLPVENSIHAFGSSITFLADITDREDGSLSGDSIVWISDQDGFFAYGSSFSTSELSVGTHGITVTATDSADLATSFTFTITVGDGAPDSVEIVKPEDGQSFTLGEYIEFEGTAMDGEDGALSGDHLIWTSNLESRVIGTGEIFGTENLSPGRHLISLTATDSTNASIVDFIMITVENNAPEPLIASPFDGTVVQDTDQVHFSGSASDGDGGTLSGNALIWRSDLDGLLGSGREASAILSPGRHVISLTAKDTYGKEATATINVSVNTTQQSLPMTLSSSYVTLALGQVGTYFVSGGAPPYRYEKNYPHIAEMEINGNEIRVTPDHMGDTVFQIFDHDNNTQTLHMSVTDTVETFPSADAGADLTVLEGSTVTLDGSNSTPGAYGISSWQWQQITEDKASIVTLFYKEATQVQFIAPWAEQSSSLNFRLTVTDGNGNISSDDVVVRVSENGLEGYPEGVISFLTADSAHSLGATLAGEGNFVAIEPQYEQFISENAGRPEHMIYGLVDLKIKVVEGGQADMILYFPTPLETDYSIYKYNKDDGWYDYSDYVTFSADRSRAYVILQDGSVGDDDGVPDGIISDPITVGTAPVDPPPLYPDGNEPDEPQSNDDGGGGCFISTLL